jgi:amino acid transporter
LPKILCKIHPKYKTPYCAIIFMATIVAVFALSGTFEYLAVVATGSILLIYLAVSLSVLRFRQRDGMPKQGEFTVPFGPVIPILSCLFVGGLLIQIPMVEAQTIGALIGVCIVIYVIKSALRKGESR